MNYFGIDLPDVAEGEVPLDAVVLLKVMAADGRICYREWKSTNLHPIEALGMTETFRDTLKMAIMSGSRPTPPPA